MKHALSALLLTICLGSFTFAQEEQDAKNRKLLDAAAKNGNGLQTQTTVNGNVHAQAVLIPKVDAYRIFGREIADHYAVIEVNVSNKSPDAALILQGIFMDYSQWPLSGATRHELNAARSTDSFQASTFPNQVATVESRVVRGQLLDAQTDTLRNRFIRWLTLAGNLAGAFTFSINEQGIVKGIAAATGVGIPGVATAWPDKTIAQLNRISDFGFQTNKVIGKQGSEVLVCFFPIDRFLTPGFRKIFLKSPALFFAPLQMLVDKTIRNDVNAAVGDLLQGFPFTVDDLRADLPCYLLIDHQPKSTAGYRQCLDKFGLELVKDPRTNDESPQVKTSSDATVNKGYFESFQRYMALDFIGGVSLNRVVVTVDGVMSVDINTVAARLDEVEMGKVDKCGDARSQCFWTDLTADDGVRKGVIHGAYLTGGTVALAEQQSLKITDPKSLPEESTDRELHFSFKLGQPLPSQTSLHFTVTKPKPAAADANSKPLESNTFEYLVDYPTAAPGIDSVSLSGETLTVNGRLFNSTMVVTLNSEARDEKQLPAASVTFVTSSQIKVAVPADLKPGCWDVQVQAGGVFSNHSDKFAIEPHPTLETAVLSKTSIVVAGDDLVDFSHCGGQRITFQFLPDPTPTAAAPAAVPLSVLDWNKGNPVLSLPPGADKDSLKGSVQVLLDGKAITENGKVTLTTGSQ